MRHRLQITRHDIDAALAHTHRHHGRRDPSPKKGTMTGHLVGSMEVLGAAAVSGVVKGKWGVDKLSVGPIPGDALGFVLLNGLGVWRNNDHLCNLGNGLGAGWAHQMGAMWGASWAASASAPSAPAAAGISGALGRGNRPLTEAELAGLAQMRARR